MASTGAERDPELTRAEVSRVARWALTLGAGERLDLACGASGAAQTGAARARSVARSPGDAGTGGGQALLQWPVCLNALDVADLAALTAAAPALRLQPCSHLHPAADALVSLLAGLGLGHRLEVRPGHGSPGGDARHTTLPVSRRDLLGWARPARQRAGGPRRAPEVSGHHGEAEQQVRLAAALRELLRQEGVVEPSSSPVEPASPDEGSPAATRAHRLTAHGCTACTTCVRACPTGALALTSPDHEQAVTLELETAACIGCRQCLALCPAQALTDQGVLTWPDLLARPATQTLETVEVRPCTRCRTPFAGEGDLCQVCSLRAKNPFGSWLPPGYVTPRVFAPVATEEDA